MSDRRLCFFCAGNHQPGADEAATHGRLPHGRLRVLRPRHLEPDVLEVARAEAHGAWVSQQPQLQVSVDLNTRPPTCFLLSFGTIKYTKWGCCERDYIPVLSSCIVVPRAVWWFPCSRVSRAYSVCPLLAFVVLVPVACVGYARCWTRRACLG